MESIDKLRKLADECYTFNDCSDKLIAVADEIEREIAERYVELPPEPRPGQDAIDYIRSELDRRGVDWKKWSKGKVETKFFAPGADSTRGSFCVSVSVSKDYRQGPVFYKGYILDPRYAIMAALDQPYTTLKPRALKDVLRDMLNDYDAGRDGDMPYSFIADHAAEICELLGVSE